jgi:5-formyltetrahydrofolate cyclo-ligase
MGIDGKAARRRELRAAAAGHSAAERAAGSEQLRRRLREQPFWRQARAVLSFAPMAEEPDIWAVAAEALAAGKRLALPRFDASRGCYWAHEVTDPVRQMCAGHYGIREPMAGCALFALKELDLILVPGLGFGPDGSRLGRGKGYYDQLLAQTAGWKCGVAFDWQVVAGTPMEGHDVFLDCILTPSRVAYCRTGAPVVK